MKRIKPKPPETSPQSPTDHDRARADLIRLISRLIARRWAQSQADSKPCETPCTGNTPIGPAGNNKAIDRRGRRVVARQIVEAAGGADIGGDAGLLRPSASAEPNCGTRPRVHPTRDIPAPLIEAE
jgi:hypothetical protein